MNISKAAKAWTALSVGGLAWGAEVVASAPASITASEWLGLAGVVVAAAGVFAMPNTDPAPQPAPQPASSAPTA